MIKVMLFCSTPGILHGCVETENSLNVLLKLEMSNRVGVVLITNYNVDVKLLYLTSNFGQ